MNCILEPMDITDSLAILTSLLCKHYNRKVILLVDEYDVPLDKAFLNGYYNDMVGFIRTFLGGALKTNDNTEFAVVTGCLRISKESIFTGVNNFSVNSVISDLGNLSECIGFTPEEVQNMLEYYDLEGYSNQVKHWMTVIALQITNCTVLGMW